MKITVLKPGTAVAVYSCGVPPSVMTKVRFFPGKPSPRSRVDDQPIIRNTPGAKSALNNRVEFIDLVEHVTQGVTVVHLWTDPGEPEPDDRG
jgi:hypothetical protein